MVIEGRSAHHLFDAVQLPLGGGRFVSLTLDSAHLSVLGSGGLDLGGEASVHFVHHFEFVL